MWDLIKNMYIFGSPDESQLIFWTFFKKFNPKINKFFFFSVTELKHGSYEELDDDSLAIRSASPASTTVILLMAAYHLLLGWRYTWPYSDHVYRLKIWASRNNVRENYCLPKFVTWKLYSSQCHLRIISNE